MDAQAQDRAHRIGQTRDVHIYRLVSEHTVEENILRKAQQKRHLDFLVMSEGQFTTDFFSKASLRELMTGSTGEEQEMESESDSRSECEDMDEDMEDENEVSLDTVENAMAQLEDEEDVVAMKGARAEYMQELNEFDDDAGNVGHVASPRLQPGHLGETRPSTPSSVISRSTAASERGDDDDDEFDTAKENQVEHSELRPSFEKGRQRNLTTYDDFERDESSDEDNEDDKKSKPSRKRQRSNTNNQKKKRHKSLESHDHNGFNDRIREKARDAAEEQKLQAWKASVQSLQGFEDSLNPVDRYALHFREDVEPLYAYTPAQQVALDGVEADPSPRTLLQDIEQIELEKREEEIRLIAEGELVVGQMDGVEGLSPEEIDKQYAELYRRERAHVLFESRKRLVTGAAWSLLKCANTGQPFYFNRDTREATWECPPVWTANEQLQSALKRGYEGLPPPALQRVMAMLTTYPERHRAQMVCRSWHTAAQHPSLFVKVSACDFELGSTASLVQVLAKVAPGDTILFGAGVYQLDEPLEISKCVRLLGASDSHIELQMHSCRAQVRWSARGGIIRGFHFTRTTSVPDAAAREIKSCKNYTAVTPVVRESKRALRKQDKKLANWQHLLSVVGDGQLRVEFCEFESNGLGNACVCVWGRGEKKKKRKRRRRDEKSTSSTLPSKPQTSLVEPLATLASTDTPLSSTTHIVAATPNDSGKSSGKEMLTTAQATASTLKGTPSSVVPVAVPAIVSLSNIPTTSVPTTTITRIVAPTLSAPVSMSPILNTGETKMPRVTSQPGDAATTTKIPAADTLLVLQNCRIRGAGSSGVLLVRGSLVMSLNTVEDNAHSGVTVLGGHAIMRRNKIQRNARFGIRLLYHAGNVIIEDNVVFGNACGNLDVDNSGRRFVIRLNEMDKQIKTSESLPHSHGKLRLKTYRLFEKKVPMDLKPATNVMSAASEYWKRQFTEYNAVAPQASVSSVSTTMSAVPPANPVIVTKNMIGASFPIGLMQSGAFAQGPHALHVSNLPMALALARAKAMIPSTTLSRLSTDTFTPGNTTNTFQRPVTIPGTTFGATTTTVSTSTNTSLFVPSKKQRTRRPKTQQTIRGDGEIILRDTCELPIEKIVKPRRPKIPQTPVLTTILPQTISSSSPSLNSNPGSTATAVAAALQVMMAKTNNSQNSQAYPSSKTQAEKEDATNFVGDDIVATKPETTSMGAKSVALTPETTEAKLTQSVSASSTSKIIATESTTTPVVAASIEGATDAGETNKGNGTNAES
ncbi:putative WW domain, pectin lyase/virulence factor, F-box-like domain superfamily [Plasmopara halstedii]